MPWAFCRERLYRLFHVAALNKTARGENSPGCLRHDPVRGQPLACRRRLNGAAPEQPAAGEGENLHALVNRYIFNKYRM